MVMCSPLVPRLRLVLNLSIFAKKKQAGYDFLTLFGAGLQSGTGWRADGRQRRSRPCL
jgi:hypothetical protein